MELFRTLARTLRLKRDRGLIFEAFCHVDGRTQFVGYLIAEFDRSPTPIGFVPMDVFFLNDEDDPIEVPLVSMFDPERMRFVDSAERRVRLGIAKRVARDHRLARGPHIHPEVVGLDGIRIENKDDKRPLILARMALLPVGKMPEHISPCADWLGWYSPRPGRSEGGVGFCVMDVEAVRRPQKKSGTSKAPIIPSPAKLGGQKAPEPTAASSNPPRCSLPGIAALLCEHHGPATRNFKSADRRAARAAWRAYSRSGGSGAAVERQ